MDRLCKYVKGAEGTASQPFLFSQGKTGYDWSYAMTGLDWSGGGVAFFRKKTRPPCVKRSPLLYNTPQQKIYAKVKCPILYTYS
jgi:hypothetical protein